MNITLNKRQWERIGLTAGWLNSTARSFITVKGIRVGISLVDKIEVIKSNWFDWSCDIELPDGRIVSGTVQASNTGEIMSDDVHFDEDCFVVKDKFIYSAAPYGIIGTIPAGTSVIKATNMPSDNKIKYWAESWFNMSDKEESWQRNYGFGLEEQDVINLKD